MFGLGSQELIIVAVFLIFDAVVMLGVVSFVLAQKNRRNGAGAGQQAQRIDELERQVATLKRQQSGGMGSGGGFNSTSQQPFGSPFDTSPGSAFGGDEISDLLRQGQKIQAIKLYRERTGVGLKEAKDAVEEIERQM